MKLWNPSRITFDQTTVGAYPDLRNPPGGGFVVCFPLAVGEYEDPATGVKARVSGPLFDPHAEPLADERQATDRAYRLFGEPTNKPADTSGRTPAEQNAFLERAKYVLRECMVKLPAGPDIEGDRRQLHTIQGLADALLVNGADVEETTHVIGEVLGPVADYDVFDVVAAYAERGVYYHDDSFSKHAIESYGEIAKAKLAATRAGRAVVESRLQPNVNSLDKLGLHGFRQSLSNERLRTLYNNDGSVTTHVREFEDTRHAYIFLPQTALGGMKLPDGTLLYGFEKLPGDTVIPCSLGQASSFGTGWPWDIRDTYVDISKVKRSTLSSYGPVDPSKFLTPGSAEAVWAESRVDACTAPWKKHEQFHVAGSAIYTGLNLGPARTVEWMRANRYSEDLIRNTVSRIERGEFVFHERGELIPEASEVDLDNAILKGNHEPWLASLGSFLATRERITMAEIEVWLRDSGLLPEGATLNKRKFQRIHRVLAALPAPFVQKRPRDENGRKQHVWIKQEAAAQVEENTSEDTSGAESAFFGAPLGASKSRREREEAALTAMVTVQVSG